MGCRYTKPLIRFRLLEKNQRCLNKMSVERNISVTLRTTIHCFVVCVAMVCSMTSVAQDKLELGLFLGGAYYIGDLNPSQHFLNTRPAAGLVVRYAFTDRLAAKLNAIGAGLKGSYPEGGNVYVGQGDYDFDRIIADIGLTGEFNFMCYDHKFFKKQSRFTPYLTAGLVATCYESYKDDSDGKQRIVLSLPFGMGVKYKVTQWLRVGFEWTMRKTFCDDLDLVGDVGMGVDPSDPYKFNENVLSHNNDWYSLAGFTITLSMWPRKLECNDGTKSFNK